MNKENVRLFLTNLGLVIGRYDILKNHNDFIHLDFPFTLQMQGVDKVSVGPILIKENWVHLYKSNINAEIPVSESLIDLYEKYYYKIFVGIETLDSKIII